MFLQFHKRNRKTLQYHMQLLELLEIPQLIETCFHNEFYDEAIELANFIYSLERRNLLTLQVKQQQAINDNVPVAATERGEDVILKIVNEVEKLLNHFIKLLIAQCTENISLPKQMTIFSTLRKLDHLFIDRKLIIERANSVGVSGDVNAILISSASFDEGEKFLLQNNSKTISSSEDDPENATAKLLEYYSSPSTPISQEEETFITRQQFLLNAEISHYMQYLEARTVWLSKQQSNVSSSSSSAKAHATNTATSSHSHATSSTACYGKCLELLEHIRTSWYTIITHYRSLFLDTAMSTPMNSVADTKTGNTLKTSNNLTFEESKQKMLQKSAFRILQGWTTKQVQALLIQLKSHLYSVRNDSRTMKMLLEQIYYASFRLSTVGCEFFPLVIPLVEGIVCEKMSLDLSNVKDKFVQMISEEKVIKVHPTTNSSTEQLVSLYHPQDFSSVVFTSASSASSTSSSTEGKANMSNLGDIPAPKCLLYYPPLAYLCNAYLQILGYLRDCPLNYCYGKILALLGDCFASISDVLVEYAHLIRSKSIKYFMNNTGNAPGAKYAATTATSNTVDLAKQYATAFAFDCAPHIFLCFELIFCQLSPLTTQLHLTRYQQAQATYYHQQSSSSPSATMPHFITEIHATKTKDLFLPPYLQYLEKYWKTLAQHNLLSNECLAKPKANPIILPKKIDDTQSESAKENLINEVSKESKEEVIDEFAPVNTAISLAAEAVNELALEETPNSDKAAIDIDGAIV